MMRTKGYGKAQKAGKSKLPRSRAMSNLAPIEYIQDYYEGSLSKAEAFPREYGFYQSFLNYVDGATLLNVGCGPLFYEDLPHFGEVPRHYVGIDVNTNTFKYLKKSQHPRLIEGRNFVKSHKIRTEFIAESVIDWAPGWTEEHSTVMVRGKLKSRCI